MSKDKAEMTSQPLNLDNIINEQIENNNNDIADKVEPTAVYLTDNIKDQVKILKSGIYQRENLVKTTRKPKNLQKITKENQNDNNNSIANKVTRKPKYLIKALTEKQKQLAIVSTNDQRIFSPTLISMQQDEEPNTNKSVATDLSRSLQINVNVLQDANSDEISNTSAIISTNVWSPERHNAHSTFNHSNLIQNDISFPNQHHIYPANSPPYPCLSLDLDTQSSTTVSVFIPAVNDISTIDTDMSFNGMSHLNPNSNSFSILSPKSNIKPLDDLSTSTDISTHANKNAYEEYNDRPIGTHQSSYTSPTLSGYDITENIDSTAKKSNTPLFSPVFSHRNKSRHRTPSISSSPSTAFVMTPSINKTSSPTLPSSTSPSSFSSSSSSSSMSSQTRKYRKPYISLTVLKADKLIHAKKGAPSRDNNGDILPDRQPGLDVTLYLPLLNNNIPSQSITHVVNNVVSDTNMVNSNSNLKQVYHTSRDFHDVTLNPIWNTTFDIPLPCPRSITQSQHKIISNTMINDDNNNSNNIINSIHNSKVIQDENINQNIIVNESNQENVNNKQKSIHHMQIKESSINTSNPNTNNKKSVESSQNTVNEAVKNSMLISLLEWWSKGKIIIQVLDSDRFNTDLFMGQSELHLSTLFAPILATACTNLNTNHSDPLKFNFTLTKRPDQHTDRVTGYIYIQTEFYLPELTYLEDMLMTTNTNKIDKKSASETNNTNTSTSRFMSPPPPHPSHNKLLSKSPLIRTKVTLSDHKSGHRSDNNNNNNNNNNNQHHSHIDIANAMLFNSPVRAMKPPHQATSPSTHTSANSNHTQSSGRSSTHHRRVKMDSVIESLSILESSMNGCQQQEDHSSDDVLNGLSFSSSSSSTLFSPIPCKQLLQSPSQTPLLKEQNTKDKEILSKLTADNHEESLDTNSTTTCSKNINTPSKELQQPTTTINNNVNNTSPFKHINLDLSSYENTSQNLDEEQQISSPHSQTYTTIEVIKSTNTPLDICIKKQTTDTVSDTCDNRDDVKERLAQLKAKTAVEFLNNRYNNNIVNSNFNTQPPLPPSIPSRGYIDGNTVTNNSVNENGIVSNINKQVNNGSTPPIRQRVFRIPRIRTNNITTLSSVDDQATVVDASVLTFNDSVAIS